MILIRSKGDDKIQSTCGAVATSKNTPTFPAPPPPPTPPSIYQHRCVRLGVSDVDVVDAGQP